MTGTAAFRAYLATLPRTVLSPRFRERIADRERRDEFPFCRQNIYRVLFAAGPVLRDGWLELAQTRPLEPDDPALGTSLRCYRYLHALLLDDLPARREVAELLEPIAARAMQVTGAPRCFCEPPPDPAGPDGRVQVRVDVALRLATSLRQLADVRWLGQHDHAFVGKPPTLTGFGALRYTRCFGRLPAETGLETVEITVGYHDMARAGIVFDPFRGEITTPPPRSAARWATIAAPTAGGDLDDATATRVLTQVVAALRDTGADPPRDRSHGEEFVADAFANELSRAARERGVDPAPWRAEIRGRLPSAAPLGDCLTHAYLDVLARSVERWGYAL